MNNLHFSCSRIKLISFIFLCLLLLFWFLFCWSKDFKVEYNITNNFLYCFNCAPCLVCSICTLVVSLLELLIVQNVKYLSNLLFSHINICYGFNCIYQKTVCESHTGASQLALFGTRVFVDWTKLRWGPCDGQYNWYLFRKGKFGDSRHKWRQDNVKVVMWPWCQRLMGHIPKLRNAKDYRGSPTAWRGKEGPSPRAVREHGPVDTLSSFSDFQPQNKVIHFCYLKPPTLWHFVMTAPGI
jgi:hypothetical protein